METLGGGATEAFVDFRPNRLGVAACTRQQGNRSERYKREQERILDEILAALLTAKDLVSCNDVTFHT